MFPYEICRYSNITGKLAQDFGAKNHTYGQMFIGIDLKTDIFNMEGNNC